MFVGCKNLETLNLQYFTTSQVRDMSYLFFGCNKLKNLKIKFDTSLVETMAHMFDSCYSLTSLDLTHFDASYNKNFSYYNT